jgi:hypothetical protein
MGKYSKFKKVLTSFSGEPNYMDKVRMKRDDILKALQGLIDVKTFAKILVNAKLEKKRLKDLESEQNLIIEAVTQELVELLEAEEFSKVDLDGGVSLSIKDDVYCKVEDKGAFHQWIHDNHLEDLFTVNYQTMSSMVKNDLLENKPIPPGIGTFFKQGILVRGVKDIDND